MIVGIAAPASEVKYHRDVKLMKKPIKEDLRSWHNLLIDVHATRIAKNATSPEASNERFEELKNMR